MVYSPLDALRIAQNEPEKHVCFFAIGFETTAPSTALTLVRARALGMRNFSVFCNHVTIVPAIRAILDSPDMRLDGFVGPGHVSTITGCRPYEFIARDYGKPVVDLGLRTARHPRSDPDDLAAAPRGRGARRKPVPPHRPVGRQHAGACARSATSSSCARTSSGAGSGFISQSALATQSAFAQWDAEAQFEVPGVRVTDPRGRAVRRGAQGRAEAAAVQALRQGVQSGAPDRRADGLERRRVRGLLPLRARGERRRGAAWRPSSARLQAPRFADAQIEMAHGAGGKASRRLVEGLIAPCFANPILRRSPMRRSSRSTARASRRRPTAYVVKPLRFPGGSIGELAVNGTVNDLRGLGRATRSALMATFILEAGLPARRSSAKSRRWRSRRASAPALPIVGGDTKVVEHGLADGMYVSTFGIGAVDDARDARSGIDPRPATACCCRGRSAITASRFCSRAASSISRPISNPIRARCGRSSKRCSPRAGRACAGCAIRRAAAWRPRSTSWSARLRLRHRALRGGDSDARRGARRLRNLGLDPLHIANEGQFLAVVAPDARRCGAAPRCARCRAASGARCIGEVRAEAARGGRRRQRLRRHARRSTCSSAIRCREYADARRATGRRSRAAHRGARSQRARRSRARFSRASAARSARAARAMRGAASDAAAAC